MYEALVVSLEVVLVAVLSKTARGSSGGRKCRGSLCMW